MVTEDVNIYNKKAAFLTKIYSCSFFSALMFAFKVYDSRKKTVKITKYFVMLNYNKNTEKVECLKDI